MTEIERIVNKIGSFMEWDPCNIFYTTSYKTSERYQHLMDDGGYYCEKEYTMLGDFMNHLPLFIDVMLKLVYYIPAWICYGCFMVLWTIFKGLFIPQKWGY